MKIDDLKELESYIELVGKPLREDDRYDLVQLTYLTTKGQGIYGQLPLTHYEVLQRGISEYIENKSKEEKSSVIQYFLGESYQPEYEKYFLKSWQKLNSPYPKRFIQLPTDVDKTGGRGLGGMIQTTYLKELRAVRIRFLNSETNDFHNNELNIESYYPLTSPQISFILDIINMNNLSSSQIIIDDWTEEMGNKMTVSVSKGGVGAKGETIKRQLRLHSIVAQFHR